MPRFPPKRILVPLDLSKPSFAALSYARELAGRFKSEVRILHVQIPPPIEAAPYYWRSETYTLERRAVLSRVRREAKARLPVTLSVGDPAATILGQARTWKADLIVMGTHGRTGLGRLLLGSVAEAVVRRSPCPVLTLRSRVKPIRSVLAPVDFTRHAEFGLAFAAHVAVTLKAKLVAQHVITDAAYPPSSLATLVRGLPQKIRDACKAQTVISEGELVDEILAEAKRHGLVLLVAHREGLLTLGMTAERVIRRSPVPVLAVPAPARKSQFSLGRLAQGLNLGGRLRLR